RHAGAPGRTRCRTSRGGAGRRAGGRRGAARSARAPPRSSAPRRRRRTRSARARAAPTPERWRRPPRPALWFATALLLPRRATDGRKQRMPVSSPGATTATGSLSGMRPLSARLAVAGVLGALVLPASATPASPPLNGVNFISVCAVSHESFDDPIVYPGRPGLSHNHTFFGNTSTNASSTLATLRAAGATTCSRKTDTAAYWAPTLLVDGAAQL